MINIAQWGQFEGEFYKSSDKMQQQDKETSTFPFNELYNKIRSSNLYTYK